MFPHLLHLTHDLFSDLIAVTRGGTSWRRIPILGTFCRVSSLLLEVPLAQGVTFWVPTHAAQVPVTYPGSVSTFLSYHAPGSSLGMTLSWVVSIPGSRCTPHWYWNPGLEVIFLSPLT